MSPASWAIETTFQSRYPGGILVTKSGAAGSSARRAADVVNATTLTSVVAASRKNAVRFMAASCTMNQMRDVRSIRRRYRGHFRISRHDRPIDCAQVAPIDHEM